MTVQQHNPPHPGELIQRTYIEPFGEVTGNKVADRLGVARSTFSRLLNGISNVSPEMAVRLSSVLEKKSGTLTI
jgi:addiction module HigA family antidote